VRAIKRPTIEGYTDNSIADSRNNGCEVEGPSDIGIWCEYYTGALFLRQRTVPRTRITWHGGDTDSEKITRRDLGNEALQSRRKQEHLPNVADMFLCIRLRRCSRTTPQRLVMRARINHYR
jgi:hypothetical protein